MEKKEYQIGATFSVAAPANLTIQGFASPSLFTPDLDPNYEFRTDILSDVLAWLKMGEGEGLFLTGPTGSGKSSIICQVAARLNLPVQRVTAHGRLEIPELVGHYAAVNGNTEFQYGPLAIAMKEGQIFLLDELDLLDPANTGGLNGIAEGTPLVIPEKGGEIIRRHPDFRFVVTGNTKGTGDISGNYQGTMKQNISFMDRFWVVHVDYPERKDEIGILKSCAPHVPDGMHEKFVDTANEIRSLFTNGSYENTVDVTMSSRTLIRWANMSVFYQGVAKKGKNPLLHALDRALLFRSNETSRQAIQGIVQRVFGF